MKKDIETIKKNQSEMKDTLTKMKNNLQGINSGVDEAKNQISDLEYNKNHPIRTANKQTNKMSKKTGQCRVSGTTSSIPKFASWGCWKENRKRKKLKT